MPIVVTQPISGDNWGPGFSITLHTDLVGPIANPSWLISLSDNDTSPGAYQDTRLVADPHVSQLYHFMVPDTGTFALPAPQRSLTEATQVYLVAQLLSGTSTVVEQTSIPVKLDMTSGLGYGLSLATLRNRGLSTDESADLTTVKANTQVTIPGFAGDIVRGIGSLFQGIPSNFVNRHTSVLISGQGSFSRTVEPFRFDCLGIEWHWNTIPPAAGKLIGDPDEYTHRVVQFRLIDQDDAGQLYQADVIDSSTDGVRHIWGIQQPVTLEYFVSPGWVVELAFLVFAAG